MNKKARHPAPALTASFIGALLGVIAPDVDAQNAPAPAAGTSSGAAPESSSPGAVSPDPNPYYIGVNQAFTHDSNVYRIAGGPSDTYSSTSLLGGFDQRISRQRVFGSANVATNRYLDNTDLNNISYGLAAGLDWETIHSLSGNLNVGLNRNLSAPVATSASATRRRNIAETQSIDGRARYGGASVLSLEGSLGHLRIDYSAPESVAANSSQDSGGLTLYYRPGGPLRLGVGGRATRTRTPQALFDPATGNYQSNTINGRYLDLLADYDVSGLLIANGRLSYTRQRNSGFSNADFSGLTGSVGLLYHATGKIDVTLQAARDAGFDSSFFNSYTVVQSGQSLVVTPVTLLYENNRVTDSVALGATYAATAKIGVKTGARYSRAKLSAVTVAASGSQAVPETTDTAKSVYVGANYAITRNVSAACNLSHERRSVSGGASFAYNATNVSCSAQLLWR